MRAMEGILQGFRGIFANKLRSGLTMLGITIGIAAVLAMVSISDGAKDIIVKDLEKMGGGNQFSVFRSEFIEKNGRWQRNTSGQFFTYEDIWALERECPSVERVVPRDFKGGLRVTAGQGIQSTETRSFTVATTDAFMEGMEWYPTEGRFVDDEDLFDWNKVVVIGTAVAEQLFGDDDPVGGEVKLNGQRFTVIGVMEQRGTSLQFGWNFDEQIIIPHTTSQKRFDGNERVNGFFVQAKSVEKVPDAYTEVLRVFEKRHGKEEFYRIFTPGQSNMEFILKLSSMLKVVLGGIAGFSLFIGGIGIMNIMFVTVTERTKEIGLRKALGARRFDILLQFLIEASVLCIAGGLMGIAAGIGFGWGSAKVISNPLIGGFISPLLGFRGEWVAWPWAISVPWILISLGVSVGVGLFFGLYPAVKASRLTPIEALRHQ